MNELIGSFAGKRLAIFGALIAAIALLAVGGALSTGGTAQAHDPAGATPTSNAEKTGRAGLGLDFIRGGASVNDFTITLAVGTEAEVCLMDDLTDQQFRDDSDNGPHAPDADPPTEDAAGDTPGAPEDIDDWDWGLRANPLGEGDPVEVGPTGILTTVPTAASATARNPATGWNWVIAKKTGTTGTPTLTNPARTFPNRGDSGEACVFWTSNAPGTQVIQLFKDSQLAATGASVYSFGSRSRDDTYTADLPAETDELNTIEKRHDAADHDDNNVATDWSVADADSQLEVTWVDSDPVIRLARLGLPTAPLGAPVGDAPIPQRMVLSGSGATQSFTPAGDATIQIRVEAIQSAVAAQALTGASVSFAVTGTCGSVNVPNAIISAGPPVVKDDIGPGQTGTIAEWGTSSVMATFSNTGEGAAACKRPNSSTTLTVTSGAATATVSVDWSWDGYGDFTVDDVDDTTKKVTFHTAVPRTYVLGQGTGWTCDDASKARIVSFDLDGRASVAGFARRNTVGGAESAPEFTAVTSTTTGATTPKRTLGAGDSECQVSWTVRSPARANDVYLDVSSIGVDTLSQLLSFAPDAPAVTTFDDLEAPLLPGNSQVIWTGEDTPVADAIGDSGATAVYLWVNATQSWLTFFPGQEGLGVNSLTMLSTGDILFVSTPRN